MCLSINNLSCRVKHSFVIVTNIAPRHEARFHQVPSAITSVGGYSLGSATPENARMLDAVRQEVIALASTVVVKVGTNVLTHEDGTLDPRRLQALADQLHRLRDGGRKVVLVSSGAIGAGMGRLGLPRRPTDLRQLQACAAVGQAFLMRAYEDCLARHGIPTAQILLTAGDFDSRGRYLNARNTILTLFEYGCLPIINENDTVSVAEIRFGDNDHLAALVTNLLQAPLLILLTVVDGLYAADPRSDPSASLLTTVPVIDAFHFGEGGQQPQRPGFRGHAEQAPRRAPGHRGRRVGHHGQRQRAGRFSMLSSAASRSARCFCRTIARCRPGSAGSATPLGRADGSSSMPERGKPSSTRAAVCCRSASSRSAALSARAMSSPY